MEKLKSLVASGKTIDVAKRVSELLDSGVKAEDIVRNAMIAAMDEVGDLFQKGEAFLPDMMLASRAMKAGMQILKPKIVGGGIKPIGKAVVGTVKGDMHDIGKNLVAMALEGAGFEVVDLGSDVSPDKFAAAVREHKPNVVGMSALLSTTMLVMKDVVAAIRNEEAGRKTKIMVGGAPVTKKYADEIGADFYGADSTAGKNYAREVASGEA